MEILTDEFIKENQNFVYSIIHKYFRNYPNKNDLYQEGMLGLSKASKTYDASLNTKFTSYAYKSVLGEMLKYVRENKGIKVSIEMQKLAAKLEKVRLLLIQKYEKEPSIKELAEYLNLSEYEVSEIIQLPKNIESLDEPINENGKMVNRYDYISEEEYYDINDKLALKSELEKLDDIDRKLLEARYMQDMTQSETAQVLGISQVQVSRNEKKVLIKLRDRLRI